jgi:hypothetical protein
MIYRWAKRLTDEVEVLAKTYCPKRTYNLANSIGSTASANQYGVFTKVRAGAHYAEYVHEGTHGPITPKHTPYLKFYGWGQWARPEPYRKSSVSGQRAQPFLRRALAEVMREHGI